MTDTVAIPPITLDAEDGSKVQFDPHPTITPLELAHCTALFFRLVMWRAEYGAHPDWQAYIAAHGLERHFVAI